ncbi:hypothetical protein V2J09_000795 [Rumex salicifolius]
MEVDPSEMRYLEDDDSPTLKVIKGTTSGFVAGTIWGTVVATWHDVPRVERSVALPGLVRTLKMMGSHGVTFAAIGGVYIGVEQLVQHYRMKRDYINGAVGGFAAGASVLGFKARSIKGALAAGSALAVTSALIDVGGQTTRIDNGKEYYPYNTKNRSAVTEISIFVEFKDPYQCVDTDLLHIRNVASGLQVTVVSSAPYNETLVYTN